MKYPRSVLIGVLAVLIALDCAGCAALQRKFTRKKKETQPSVYYELEKYTKEPNEVIYKKHYIFWKTWQEELINKMNEQNNKMNIRCATEAMTNLEDMRRLLKEEKAKEMEPYIAEIRDIKKEFENRLITVSRKNRIKSLLEKRYRKIKRDFSYKKIGNYILADEIPAGDAASDEPVQEK